MIERVIKYSVSMYQDKSLLYTTSSDLSLIFGYYLPISMHAMRVYNDMEFISKYQYNFDTSSSYFLKRPSKDMTKIRNLLIDIADAKAYMRDDFQVHVPYDCKLFISEVLTVRSQDNCGVYFTEHGKAHKTKNRLEPLKSHTVYRGNGESGIHIPSAIDNLSTYERIYPFCCGYFLKSDRNRPSIFIQHEKWHLSINDKVSFYDYKQVNIGIFDKYAYYDSYYYLDNKDKQAAIDNQHDFVSKHKNEMFVVGNIFQIGNTNVNIYSVDNANASRIVGQLNDHNDIVFLGSQSKDAMYYDTHCFLDSDSQRIYSDSQLTSISMNSGGVNYTDAPYSLIKNDLGLLSSSSNEQASQESKSAFSFMTDTTIYGSDTSIYGKTEETYVANGSDDISPYDVFLFAEIASKPIYNGTKSLFISKQTKNTYQNMGLLGLYKDTKYKVNISTSYKRLSKTESLLAYNEHMYYLGEDDYSLLDGDEFYFVGKGSKPIFTLYDFYHFGKSETGIGDVKFSGHISKYYKAVDHYSTSDFLWRDKYYRALYDSDVNYASKLYVGLFGADVLNTACKSGYNTTTDDSTVYIKKGSRETNTLGEPSLIDKIPKSIRNDKEDIFDIYKVAKPFDVSMFITSVHKVPYPIMESKFLNFIERSKMKKMFLTDLFSIDDGRFNTAIDDTVIFINETGGMFANDTVSTARTGIKNVFMPKEDKEFLKISDFRHIDLNKVGQTSITSDSVPDKYITTNYKELSGIDELILPHSDFDYTVYEASLVVDGTINPHYVKKIEDGNTYIRYPIENPIKPFADIATLYMDVPVNTVEYIAKKAYSIWRERIFTYSGMKPDSAIRDLVKRVYENLELHFVDETSLYQAYRIARLFRWYAEMSILNNSEYMLKLNCKSAKPDYVSIDTSDLEKNLQLDNLYLSSELLIESISIGEKASIKVSCEKYHTLCITAKMYIYDGYVEAIVNGKNTIYKEEYTELNIEIPTGKSNVEIVFYPFNSSSKLQFAQFEITNFHIESYSIIYNGKIGESNKTIEYLINTLVIAEDAMTNMQANLAMATPIANALDNMRHYFEIHHEDKSKGKRLINKFL